MSGTEKEAAKNILPVKVPFRQFMCTPDGEGIIIFIHIDEVRLLSKSLLHAIAEYDREESK